MSDHSEIALTAEHAAHLFELFALIVLLQERFEEEDAVEAAHRVRALFERYIESEMKLSNFLFAIRCEELDSLLDLLETQPTDDEQEDEEDE